MEVLRLPLLLYVISLLFSGWQPFDWTFSAASLSQNMIPQHLIPFYAYFQHTDLWNMYDLMTAMLSFVPISLYIAMRGRNQGQSWRAIVCTTTLLALLLGAVIEGMQLFSLSRAADITDVLSYGVGGSIGVFALYYYERQILPTLAILGRSRTGVGRFKGPWGR
jgi:glycopeptide antibiotics resistance protein